MFSRNMFYKMCHALSIQRPGRGPSMVFTNRPQGVSFQHKPVNENLKLRPKPMTQEDVAGVRKLTGYAPFVEVKFV